MNTPITRLANRYNKKLPGILRGGKYLRTAVIIIFLCFAARGITQVTGNLGFEYSFLLRNAAGKPQPLQPVALKVFLLPAQNSPVAAAVWAENQSVTTDIYGFANIVIGTGTRTGGAATFSAVDFTAANYWVLIQAFNAGANAYQTYISEALMAVAYAKTAGKVAGAAGLPPGIITPFAGDVSHLPAGWVLCNGQELDNTNPLYTPLFNAIGFNWGTSDSSHKFKVPNTAGVFLRGRSGNGSLYDASTRTQSAQGSASGNNVGSYQQDAFFMHQHVIHQGGGTLTSSEKNNANESELVDSTGVTNNTGLTSFHSYPFMIKVWGNTKVSNNETRPVNVAVNYIIKL